MQEVLGFGLLIVYGFHGIYRTYPIVRGSQRIATEKDHRHFNFFRGFYFFSHLLASKICHYKTGVLSFEPSF